jgi:hypothetical protein
MGRADTPLRYPGNPRPDMASYATTCLIVRCRWLCFVLAAVGCKCILRRNSSMAVSSDIDSIPSARKKEHVWDLEIGEIVSCRRLWRESCSRGCWAGFVSAVLASASAFTACPLEHPEPIMLSVRPTSLPTRWHSHGLAVCQRWDPE